MPKKYDDFLKERQDTACQERVQTLTKIYSEPKTVGLSSCEGESSEASSDSETNGESSTNVLPHCLKKNKAVFKQMKQKDANLLFRTLNQQNSVIITPRSSVQAWDSMPRMAILETNISKFSQKRESRLQKKESVKNKFVGSPLRSPENGGLLKPKSKKTRVKGMDEEDTLNEEEVLKSNR